MSAASPPLIAVILPPREGFGPRRARGIGLTVRHHALGVPRHRTVVFGGYQPGPVFPDVTFRRVIAPYFFSGAADVRHILGLLPPLRALRPDLIEVHAAPVVAWWLRRVFPAIPVVLILHDDPAGTPGIRSAKQRQRIHDQLARIVTVSGWVRDRWLEGVTEGDRPPLLVPPCVDLASLPVIDANTPVSGRRTRLILFAGRLVPEKGVDQFIAGCAGALPFLPGWRAEIIGGAEHAVKSLDTPYVRLLHARADPAGIALMGYRDHPDVMHAMARAAIVVIPCLEPEPSGRLALEAMANGAAVICTEAGGIKEVTGSAAMYVNPGDPVAIATAIRSLAGDLNGLTPWSAAGRERASLFDVKIIGRWLETVRERIIIEGPRNG